MCSSAAILNAQPMGFYAPAQLVRDAREHGVEVRPVDVNASRWDCTLEPVGERPACRAARAAPGASGLANADGARIVAARGERAVHVDRGSLAAGRRAESRALERLAEADAFRHRWA